MKKSVNRPRDWDGQKEEYSLSGLNGDSHPGSTRPSGTSNKGTRFRPTQAISFRDKAAFQGRPWSGRAVALRMTDLVALSSSVKILGKHLHRINDNFAT